MGIFSWMQNKLYGTQEKKISTPSSAVPRKTPASSSHNEEFEDWPQALLAIGTLGDNKMKEDASRTEPSNIISQASQLPPDFSSEEVVKLQKELTRLLAQTPKANSIPLSRFLNCPASLDADRATMGNNDYANIILSKAKDLLAGSYSGVRKTSLKFMLKKMLVCHSGFVPTPSLRDPISESRMDEILKAVLHKKIYTHSAAQPTKKKYFEKQPSVQKFLDSQREGANEERGEQSSKWVKTDSEYIVLEI